MKYCTCYNEILVWKSAGWDQLKKLNNKNVKSYFISPLLWLQSSTDGRYVCDRCRKRAKFSYLTFSKKMLFFCSKLPALAFLCLLLKYPFFMVYPDNFQAALDGAIIALASIYFFKPRENEYDDPTVPPQE